MSGEVRRLRASQRIWARVARWQSRAVCVSVWRGGMAWRGGAVLAPCVGRYENGAPLSPREWRAVRVWRVWY